MDALVPTKNSDARPAPKFRRDTVSVVAAGPRKAPGCQLTLVCPGVACKSGHKQSRVRGTAGARLETEHDKVPCHSRYLFSCANSSKEA